MKVEHTGIQQLEVSNFLSDQKTSIIVKRHNNRNDYLKVQDLWIRNFCKKNVDCKDINNFYNQDEIKGLINNEIKNSKLNFPSIGEELLQFDKMIIVSDGYGFDQHKDIFNIMPEKTVIITVNQALRLWDAIIFPTFYLIANSSENAMSILPEKRFPQLIASKRTYHQYLCNYRNIVYFYDPVPDYSYQSPSFKESLMLVDDYRNPIAACVGLAYAFKVKNIYLAYCSHAFKQRRDGTTELQQDVFQYPQQKLADEVVDANLFWFKAAIPQIQIFHTGLKNSLKFSRYLNKELFQKALYL